MAKNNQTYPELMVLAQSAQAIYRRFHGWPDLSAGPEVLQQLLQNPGQLDQTARSALEQTGLLHAGSEPARLTLPIYEQLPLSAWAEELNGAISSRRSDLQGCLQLLARRWSGPGLPAWSDVAHSFAVNYLLWGLGGRLLLRTWAAEAAAVVVEALPTSRGLWPGLVRANQQAGVSCPLGQLYQQSVDIRDQLNKAEVVQALQTINDDRTMVVAMPVAGRILGRLSAMSGDRLEDGSQRVSWPWLEATALRPLQKELALWAGALRLLLQQTVRPLVEASASDLGFLPVDLGLAAYALLVDLLAEDWLQAGLLPELVVPILGGL